MSRLIDANKLIAHLNDFALAIAPPFKDNSWEYKMMRCEYKIVQECIRGVEEQPTVEAITVEFIEEIIGYSDPEEQEALRMLLRVWELCEEEK